MCLLVFQLCACMAQTNESMNKTHTAAYWNDCIINIHNINHLWKIGNAEDKADAIKNVGLATSIETSHSIKQWVKAADLSTLGVRLETIQRDCFYEHDVDECCSRKETQAEQYCSIH